LKLIYCKVEKSNNIIGESGRMGVGRTCLMPKYDKMNWEQEKLKVYLRPKGWRHVFFWLEPFLSGDTLDLKLYAKSKSDAKQEYSYAWVLEELLPDKTYKLYEPFLGSFTSEPSRTRSKQLTTHVVHHEGNYHIVVTITNDTGKSYPQTLLNFRVIARDPLYLTLVFSVISFIAGLLFKMLIR